MAVGYADILGMVYVDAVAVAYFQVVQNGDAVDGRIVAADEVHSPVGTVADGYIANHRFFNVDKRQHVRTGIEIGHRLQLIGVFQFLAHKGNAVPVNGTCPGDGDLFQIFTVNPHHALAAVIAESALRIHRLIGVGNQAGIRLQMKIHKGSQRKRTAHESVSCRNEHCSTTRFGAYFNSCLYGGSVIGLAVAFGSVIHNIINVPPGLRGAASS